MRTLKYSKGCRIEIIQSGNGFLMKRKGNCPRELVQALLDEVKNSKIIRK